MKNQKTQALWAVGLVAVLALGAYAYSGWLEQTKDSEDVSVATATPTASSSASASPTASATASSSPTPSPSATTVSKYKTLKSGFGFSIEYPKEWSFSKQSSCEGLCSATYTVVTTSKEDGVLNQEFTTIRALAYPKGEYNLERVSKEEGEDITKSRDNVTDVKLGTKAYSAKRYDDGGGLYGFLMTYLVVVDDVAMHINFYQDDPKAKPAADLQHILDTLTFDTSLNTLNN